VALGALRFGIGRCADAEDPFLAFPAHFAPNGLHFYSGDQFPGKYRGAAFIAFHGGTNLPESYNVTVVRFTNGRSHKPEVFADGFIGEGAVNLPADADHRAMALAEGPDGSLYITDDARGADLESAAREPKTVKDGLFVSAFSGGAQQAPA
jgi:glucose/arabinose dehydrogenase